jgi:signal transduction histidine kinase
VLQHFFFADRIYSYCSLILVAVCAFALSTSLHRILVIALAVLQVALYIFRMNSYHSNLEILSWISTLFVSYFIVNKLKKIYLHYKLTREKNSYLELMHVHSLDSRALVHEIRQPLSCLLMQTQLLLEMSDEWDLPDDCKNMILSLHGRSQEISNTTASIESLITQGDNHMQAVDLCCVVQEAIDSSLISIKTNFIRIAFEFNETCMIEANRHQLSILIKNILKNAIRSVTKNRSSKRFIKVNVTSSQYLVYLSVADNGSGFNTSLFARSFWFSYKPEGMGVGLPIINSIVKAHQAQIHYGSSSDLGGACVQIKFNKIPNLGVPSKGIDKELLFESVVLH